MILFQDKNTLKLTTPHIPEKYFIVKWYFSRIKILWNLQPDISQKNISWLNDELMSRIKIRFKLYLFQADLLDRDFHPIPPPPQRKNTDGTWSICLAMGGCLLQIFSTTLYTSKFWMLMTPMQKFEFSLNSTQLATNTWGGANKEPKRKWGGHSLEPWLVPCFTKPFLIPCFVQSTTPPHTQEWDSVIF